MFPCRVFVGGMPFTYEEDTIREYWNFCGAIESLEVLSLRGSDMSLAMLLRTIRTRRRDL